MQPPLLDIEVLNHVQISLSPQRRLSHFRVVDDALLDEINGVARLGASASVIYSVVSRRRGSPMIRAGVCQLIYRDVMDDPKLRAYTPGGRNSYNMVLLLK